MTSDTGSQYVILRILCLTKIIYYLKNISRELDRHGAKNVETLKHEIGFDFSSMCWTCDNDDEHD